MGQAIRAIMKIFPNYGLKDHYGQINMAINEACLNLQINLGDKCSLAPKPSLCQTTYKDNTVDSNSVLLRTVFFL